jgi:hypothetical protein
LRNLLTLFWHCAGGDTSTSLSTPAGGTHWCASWLACVICNTNMAEKLMN